MNIITLGTSVAVIAAVVTFSLTTKAKDSECLIKTQEAKHEATANVQKLRDMDKTNHGLRNDEFSQWLLDNGHSREELHPL